MLKWIAFIILLGLLFSCSSEKKTTIPKASVPDFISGVDLSYVNQVEDHGGKFRVKGIEADPFRIFQEHGASTVRVRLWHNPEWTKKLNGGKTYSDLADVIKTIRRARQAGMMVNLDFHYSDDWSDPAKQAVPKAWEGLALPLLKDSVYNYTLAVLNQLKLLGLVPEMVQVGNENNNGIMFPLGKVSNDDWSSFASLLNSGIDAVRDFSKTSSIKPRIIIHVAQLQNAFHWLKNLTAAGVNDFDIIGLSHYFKWSEVTSMQAISDTISAIRNKYGKEVMVVETAYPWTALNADLYPNVISGADAFEQYPASPEGQQRYLCDLVDAIRKGGGKGVMYWEPAWISSRLRDQWGQGSSWDNCTLFDFEGNVLPAMNCLGH
ncbi:glycosyl hydrolase 53 family protein [Flavihumibacter sp. ZG627]|uniref:glycoside hydrolase family 53 protein n=1 Tax=Flavihumibacter sp. ZG627 TaxID=1463156 RepID=UPI0009079BF7|nr:glycosyl hydrolase 53 family protein [Flavihumibacter sp. ZG627]